MSNPYKLWCCLVCTFEEGAPFSMVHYVACHDCSEILKNTKYENKCLECGKEIDNLLDEQKVEDVSESENETKGINLCMMCETNPVQTMVLPCMHLRRRRAIFNGALYCMSSMFGKIARYQ